MTEDLDRGRGLARWMGRPSAETAPAVNGFLVIVWALFWTAQQFEFLRAEGFSKALTSIALWSGVIALFAIAWTSFLIIKRAAQQVVVQWRLVAAGVAILAGALLLALIITYAVTGSAAYGLTITAWTVGKNAILIVLGLAMLGWAVRANVELPLPVAVGLAVVSLVVCLVAALLATQLPVWALRILALAILGGLAWLAIRNPGAAKSVAILAALIASLILLHESSGVVLLILVLPVMFAWLTTYVRFGSEPDNPRWWLAAAQYACWIVVTLAEAFVFR